MAREPHYRGVTPEELPEMPRQPLIMMLDSLRSVFNVGSLFRTADAAGLAEIVLTGCIATPPDPRLGKTSLGAQDYVPWRYIQGCIEAVQTLQAEGNTVVAVEAQPETLSYTAFEWPRPAVFILGNEVTGIHPALCDAADAVVHVPMYGFKQSINVATVGGIVAYEVLRQWGQETRIGP